MFNVHKIRQITSKWTESYCLAKRSYLMVSNYLSTEGIFIGTLPKSFLTKMYLLSNQVVKDRVKKTCIERKKECWGSYSPGNQLNLYFGSLVPSRRKDGKDGCREREWIPKSIQTRARAFKNTLGRFLESTLL